MKYFDWNAGAPLRPEVAAHLVELLQTPLGNPASVHAWGRRARRTVEQARERAAAALGVSPKELVFTGSGSAAAALALRGAYFARSDARRSGVVISAIEHPSVLATAAVLERHGATVQRVPPGPDGVVSAEAFTAALGADVAIASLMWANNETGALQPVEAVAAACEARGIVFHTDAVQAVGRVPIDLRQVHAPLLSCSAHKLGGPAGVGLLVCPPSLALEPLVAGHQEGGRRAGTPSAALLSGAALALELSRAALPDMPRVAALRDELEATVRAAVEGVTVSAEAAPRLAGTSNVRFAGLAAEALLIALDLDGYAVSTGAACASGSLAPSHVLTAMGLSPAEARSALRISFGPSATREDVAGLAAALVAAARRARAVR